MTDAAMEHVQAAIRYRNLSLRAFVAMLCAGAALTVVLAAAQRWWAGAAEAGGPLLAGVWPDFATLVLGHFALAFLIGVILQGVLELTVLRHLREIVRQVRGGWLTRDQPVRLKRPGPGVADDIDRIVCALNEARDHRAGSLSALVRQVAERRAAERRLCREVSRLEAENEALRRAGDAQAGMGHAAVAGSRAGEDLVAKAGIKDARAELPGQGGRDEAAGGISRWPVALEEVLPGAVAGMGGDIVATGAHVEMAPLPVVIGDAAQLARLFRGLISAAIRLRSPGGPPSVRVMAGECGGDGRVPIILRSTGIGVGPADRDPLVPIKSGGPDMVVSGDQMELALCRRIAAEHGSAITLRPAPGGGTVFEVSLEAF